jgi:uncharacterized membrane protein
MEKLTYLSEIVFVVASFVCVDWFDKIGLLKKIFGERFYYGGGIIIFIGIQIIPLFMPDVATIIVAVAMFAGYIVWRIGRSKGKEKNEQRENRSAAGAASQGRVPAGELPELQPKRKLQESGSRAGRGSD